nr:vegetative cell wall protein gp1-like [Aegilops tauschii subsp. strangulata]
MEDRGRTSSSAEPADAEVILKIKFATRDTWRMSLHGPPTHPDRSITSLARPPTAPPLPGLAGSSPVPRLRPRPRVFLPCAAASSPPLRAPPRRGGLVPGPADASPARRPRPPGPAGTSPAWQPLPRPRECLPSAAASSSAPRAPPRHGGLASLAPRPLPRDAAHLAVRHPGNDLSRSRDAAPGAGCNRHSSPSLPQPRSAYPAARASNFDLRRRPSRAGSARR